MTSASWTPVAGAVSYDVRTEVVRGVETICSVTAVLADGERVPCEIQLSEGEPVSGTWQ